MAVLTLPTDLRISNLGWGLMRNDVSFKGPFGSQSLVVAAPLWQAGITVDVAMDHQAGSWQALLLRLRGQLNQLALHNLGRPVPLGTLRGNLSLNGAHAAGTTDLVIVSSGGGGFTLLPGDFLGLGNGLTQQVVMVVAPAVTNASGFINITVEPPLRNPQADGAAVEWDKPTALFRATQKDFGWQRQSVVVSGMTLDLIEDPRP